MIAIWAFAENLKAEILHTALRKICDGQGFLGHIGGDDFVVMLPADKLMAFGEEVVNSFDEGAPSFYNDDDRERGHIVSVDRQGRINSFPITSISMGGMYLRDYWFSRSVEVAEVCAEVKHKAKTVIGSNLFVDRREADPSPLGQPVGGAVGHSHDPGPS